MRIDRNYSHLVRMFLSRLPKAGFFGSFGDTYVASASTICRLCVCVQATVFNDLVTRERTSNVLSKSRVNTDSHIYIFLLMLVTSEILFNNFKRYTHMYV